MNDMGELPAGDVEHELAAELETWDWARTAGVSADDLRQALRASPPGVEPGKAA